MAGNFNTEPKQTSLIVYCAKNVHCMKYDEKYGNVLGKPRPIVGRNATGGGVNM